ncbi:MAG TPA: hypothetical protein VF623_01630 [Segetibacter sp.]|jgi:hypothetical protein
MSKSTEPKRSRNEFVISYLVLRRAVGILGIALPLVLIAGFHFLNKNCRLPPSISHYYYTGFGTYFTGTLCAVALFLFSYNGPEDKDKWTAMLASVCALGVAFCPTNPYGDTGDTCIIVHLSVNATRNALHYGFAATFFITLAYMSIFLFTKTSDPTPTPEKCIRNKIYVACGCVILVCIITIFLLTLLQQNVIADPKKIDISTFVLETISLFAFGFSWLVKGKTIVTDKENY